MRAILTVFAKEFRENLRERRTLFSALLLGPLLVPLLFAGFLLGCRSAHSAGSRTGRSRSPWRTPSVRRT